MSMGRYAFEFRTLKNNNEKRRKKKVKKNLKRMDRYKMLCWAHHNNGLEKSFHTLYNISMLCGVNRKLLPENFIL